MKACKGAAAFKLLSLLFFLRVQNRFLLPNQPCLLPYDLVKHWPAFARWTQRSSRPDTSRDSQHGANIDWQRLTVDYGSHVVPVVISPPLRGSEEHEEDQPEDQRLEVPLAEALSRSRAASDPSPNGQHRSNAELLYIKDWHLVRQAHMRATAQQDPPECSSSSAEEKNEQERRQPYITPDIFADDCKLHESSEHCFEKNES